MIGYWHHTLDWSQSKVFLVCLMSTKNYYLFHLWLAYIRALQHFGKYTALKNFRARAEMPLSTDSTEI